MFWKKRQGPLQRFEAILSTCTSCGVEHRGMFDLAAFAPDHWEGAEEYEPNSALRMDADFLSEDFCVLDGEHFFVRCIMHFPVDGLSETFGFGCWSTLSRANFEKYLDEFDSSRLADPGPWTGWFANTLKPYPISVNEPCWVHPQPGRQRPTIKLHHAEHALAKAADEGISVEQLLAIYAANGHEFDAPTA